LLERASRSFSSSHTSRLGIEWPLRDPGWRSTFFFFLTRLRQTDCFTSIILSSPQFSLFSIVHRPATLTPSDPLPYPVPFSGYFLQSQSSNLILFRLPLINMFLDPFLTPLGNSRETLASGDTGLGLGLIFRVVHSEGLPSSPLRIFASRELRKRKFEIMRWEGGVDLGEIKGSRFFSCSVVFFYLFFSSLLWLLCYLLSLFLPGGLYS